MIPKPCNYSILLDPRIKHLHSTKKPVSHQASTPCLLTRHQCNTLSPTPPESEKAKHEFSLHDSPPAQNHYCITPLDDPVPSEKAAPHAYAICNLQSASASAICNRHRPNHGRGGQWRRQPWSRVGTAVLRTPGTLPCRICLCNTLYSNVPMRQSGLRRACVTTQPCTTPPPSGSSRPGRDYGTRL